MYKVLFSGLKKFICYNLTPSDTAVTVQRRYKHFDWLYGRLTERFPIIVIPKLPEKQASGRFEEDFIEARMARLKLWVNNEFLSIFAIKRHNVKHLNIFCLIAVVNFAENKTNKICSTSTQKILIGMSIEKAKLILCFF